MSNSTFVPFVHRPAAIEPQQQLIWAMVPESTKSPCAINLRSDASSLPVVFLSRQRGAEWTDAQRKFNLAAMVRLYRLETKKAPDANSVAPVVARSMGEKAVVKVKRSSATKKAGQKRKAPAQQSDELRVTSAPGSDVVIIKRTKATKATAPKKSGQRKRKAPASTKKQRTKSASRPKAKKPRVVADESKQGEEEEHGKVEDAISAKSETIAESSNKGKHEEDERDEKDEEDEEDEANEEDEQDEQDEESEEDEKNEDM